MNRRFTNTALASALCLTLTACGDSGGDDNPANPSGGGLEGSWLSSCVPDGEGEFDTTLLEISGRDLTVTVTTFEDPTCTRRSIGISSDGSLTPGEQVPIPGEAPATEVTIRYGSVALTLFEEQSVQNFNAAAACGRTDWSVGVSFDVIGCDLGTGPLVLPDEYNIYRVDGNVLLLGDIEADGAGETPQTRPSTLDRSEPFVRTTAG